MSKTKSEWTNENIDRYIDLIRIHKMTAEEARKAVKKSIETRKIIKK